MNSFPTVRILVLSVLMMASAHGDCSDRDFKSEPAAEEGSLDSEDSTGEKRPSAVSSPLYYPDSEDDGCCGDSGDFVRAADGLDSPKTHGLLASPSASRGAGGGDLSKINGQDFTSNSIYGDSTYIIGWALQSNVLNVASLEHWKKKVRGILDQLEHYTIKHVSRTFNHRVDHLSKKDLSLEEGLLQITHFHELRPPEIVTVQIY